MSTSLNANSQTTYCNHLHPASKMVQHSIVILLSLLIINATSIHVRGIDCIGCKDFAESPMTESLHPPGTPPSDAEESETGDEKKEPGEEPVEGFAFFPASIKERQEAKLAPTDPHVEEAKQDGQPWQPYIPHGIDMGASSMLTGDSFMGKPLTANYHNTVQGQHTPDDFQ